MVDFQVGLPLYAHSWYVPGLTGTDWHHFGHKSVNQGECCGPFKATMGAKPGQGCGLCGSMMYSEILASQSHITNQKGATSGFEMCFTGFPAPKVPTKTRLDPA